MYRFSSQGGQVPSPSLDGQRSWSCCFSGNRGSRHLEKKGSYWGSFSPQYVLVFLSLFALLFGSCASPAGEPVSVPVLLSPANNQDNVAFHQGIDFQWEGDSDGSSITYDLYLGKGSLPLEPTYGDLTSTSYIVPFGDLDFETSYQWKITAKNSGGKTEESGIFSFTTPVELLYENSYANAHYAWFDYTSYRRDEIVDFAAVAEGESSDASDYTGLNPDIQNDYAGRVKSSESTAGYVDLAGGRHFRAQIKGGQIQRVSFYNLSADSAYDFYAFYADGSKKFLGSVRTKAASTAYDGETAEGIVDITAHVGQTILIPDMRGTVDLSVNNLVGRSFLSGSEATAPAETIHAINISLSGGAYKIAGEDQYLYSYSIKGNNQYYVLFKNMPLDADTRVNDSLNFISHKGMIEFKTLTAQWGITPVSTRVKIEELKESSDGVVLE